MDTATAVNLLLAVGALAISAATYFSQRKKNQAESRKASAESKKADADATETWQNIATRTVAQYEDVCQRMDRMEIKVARLKKTIDTWRVGIGKLIQQILDLNHVPVWQPCPEDEESVDE